MPRKWVPEDMYVVGERPEIPPEAVKSAARVVQILDLFDEIQRPATVVEICNRLRYPQSSTSAILRTLVSTGLLHHNACKRTYIPTRRVTLLGAWIDDALFGRSKVRRLLDVLNEQTGAIVLLATRNGRFAKYIDVVQPKAPWASERSVHMTLGTERKLTRSACGQVILAGLHDSEIRRIVTATNAWSEPEEERSSFAEVMERVNRVRKCGYALSLGLTNAGTGCIAMPIACSDAEQLLVVAIAGPKDLLVAEEKRYASLLRAAMRVFELDGGPELFGAAMAL